MTRLVIDGESVASPHPATGSHLPDPPLPRTAAEINPAPPDPGACPTCGQPRANAVNGFATGDRAHPSLRVPVIEPGPEDGDHVRTQERSHR